MFCTECGTHLLNAAEFCSSCGAPRYSVSKTDTVSPRFNDVAAELNTATFAGESANTSAPQTTLNNIRCSSSLPAVLDSINKRKMISVSVNAGLGGAFGLLLGTSIVHFVGLSRIDKMLEILGVAVVAVAVVKFVEPIAEQFRVVLHIKSDHHVEQAAQVPLSTKFYAGLIVAAISLADGMLHSLVQNDPGAGPGYAIAGLIPGGITYCWLRAVRWSPPRAKLYGFTGGALISLVFLTLLLLALRTPAEDFRLLLFRSSLSWGLAGFAGGLAIERGWGRGPTRGILLSTVASCALVDFVFVMYDIVVRTQPMSDLSVMVVRDILRTMGWGVALMLYPVADGMFAVTQPGQIRSRDAYVDPLSRGEE